MSGQPLKQSTTYTTIDPSLLLDNSPSVAGNDLFPTISRDFAPDAASARPSVNTDVRKALEHPGSFRKDGGPSPPKQIGDIFNFDVEFPASSPEPPTPEQNPDLPKDSRRRRTLIDKLSKRLLDTFFSGNHYPEESELKNLAKRTKLPLHTVKNWFGNARSRKKPTQNSEDEKGKRKSGMNSAISRYLAAPISNEIAGDFTGLYQTIQHGVAELEYRSVRQPVLYQPQFGTNRLSVPKDRLGIPTFPGELYSEMSSYTPAYFEPSPRELSPRPDYFAAPHSVLSTKTKGSRFSGLSTLSSDSRRSRKGRRRWKAANKRETFDGNIAFHCTSPGCGKCFISRSEWIRHEETVHWPQCSWICCKDFRDVGMNEDMFEACKSKPEADRTFFRKDHFKSHLKAWHYPTYRLTSLKDMETLARSWSNNITYTVDHECLRCTACDSTFPTWPARREHVQQHFKNGVYIWKTQIRAIEEGSVFVPPKIPGILYGPSFYTYLFTD